MNKKKVIAAAIVLVLVVLIGSVLAYFTDTDTATNIFTLGDKIDIAIVENNAWTQDGETTNWINANARDIHPGTVVSKEPSIKNKSTTTPAYVFAEVKVPCYASTGTTVDTPLFTLNNIGEGWTKISSNETVNTTDKTISYVYAYGTSTAMTTLAANTTTATPVFTTVTLAPSLTAEQKDTASATPNIVVNGYGIQIDNLNVTSPSAIFALFGNH